MSSQIIIKEAKTAADFLETKELIFEYVNWLGISGGEEAKVTLSAQNFEKEIETLHVTYSYPYGGILLALRNNKAVGVAGIKRFNDMECELKRMFVQPESRGLGIGKLLLTRCIELAQRLNYKTIKLDTLGFMKPAIKIYTDHGFVEIPAYRENTHKEARYFELDLKRRDNLQIETTMNR